MGGCFGKPQVGAAAAARDEQQGGPRGGWDFGGGWRASRCREARVGGGGGWCSLPEAWGFGWGGGVSPGIFNGWPAAAGRALLGVACVFVHFSFTFFRSLEINLPGLSVAGMLY